MPEFRLPGWGSPWLAGSPVLSRGACNLVCRAPRLSGPHPPSSLKLESRQLACHLLDEQESLPEGQVSTSVGHTQGRAADSRGCSEGKASQGLCLEPSRSSEVSPVIMKGGHLVTCGWPFSKL